MKIALLGDIAFTGILNTEPELNESRYREISNKLSTFDFIFGNLEVPIKVDNEQNEYKNFIHYSEYFTTKTLLTKFNVSCVSLANNHVYDCKMSGLKATISVLDELNIKHTGAGWKQKHIAPVQIELNGIRIGFLAYVDIGTNPKTEKFSQLYINYFEIDTVLNDIGLLMESTDKIIVSLHWGADYSYYPTPKQIKLARTIIDAGAEIIMGHHSHTFQPYEAYKQGYIFYSLGGLTFGDYFKDGKRQGLFRKTKKSAVVSCDLFDMNLEFLPTKELKGNIIKLDKRDYTKWSKKRWWLYKIKYSHFLMGWMFDFQERVLYRIYEYFFGFYQNPLKRMLQISNFKKIRRLFSDLRGNRN